MVRNPFRMARVVAVLLGALLPGCGGDDSGSDWAGRRMRRTGFVRWSGNAQRVRVHGQDVRADGADLRRGT